MTASSERHTRTARDTCVTRDVRANRNTRAAGNTRAASRPALVLLWLLALAGASTVQAAAATAAAAAAAAATSGPAIPAARHAAGWQVLGCRRYILTVGSLDRSLAFYRDVVGLPVRREPRAAAADRTIERLTDTPGALSRSALLQLPGSDAQLLLVEFTHIDRKLLRPRITDPGAATVEVQVRDLERTVQAARRAGGAVLTRGGRPVAEMPEGRAIVLIDPDGFYVRVAQIPDVASDGSPAPASPPPASSSPASDVVDAHVVYTVAAAATVVRFYRDVLGLSVTGSGFAGGPTLDALIDSPRSEANHIQARSTHAEVLRFVAFRGIARHTFLSRPQDPGSPAAAVAVTNLAAALRALRGAGAPILSAGGQPVSLPHGSMAILVRDPAGILLELIQES